MTPNKFLEDCFALLASSEEVRDRFNSVRLADLINNNSKGLMNYYGEAVDVPYFQPRGRAGEQFVSLGYNDKFLVITTLLSKAKNPETGELEAVIPFLNSWAQLEPIPKRTHSVNALAYAANVEAWAERTKNDTLLELLNKTFNNLITLQGKSLDEALEIINQIYLDNL